MQTKLLAVFFIAAFFKKEEVVHGDDEAPTTFAQKLSIDTTTQANLHSASTEKETTAAQQPSHDQSAQQQQLAKLEESLNEAIKALHALKLLAKSHHPTPSSEETPVTTPPPPATTFLEERNITTIWVVPQEATTHPPETRWVNLSFAEAIKLENLDVLKYLRRRADWINRLEHGLDLIHYAAALGSLQTLKYLIEEGVADKNQESELGGFTPLHLAVLKNQSSIVNYLLEKGADVNATTWKGFTPLHMAVGGYGYDAKPYEPLLHEGGEHILSNVVARCGSLNLTQQLIQSGADVNARTENSGDAPIHFAAAKMDCGLEVVKALGSAGANVTARKDDGAIPLFLARVDGPVFKWILEKMWNTRMAEEERDSEGDKIGTTEGIIVDVMARDKDGYTPLIRSARLGPLQSIKYFVEHGADINAQVPFYNYSALYYAANSHYSLERVSYLVEHGAFINATDRYGRTPLHWAAQGRSSLERDDTLKYLLVKGAAAGVNARDIFEETPLLFVASRSHPNAILLLIKAGADVNAKSNAGNTPLHLALIFGDSRNKRSVEAGQLLIKFGAQLDARNNRGETARELAKRKGFSFA